MPDFLLLMVLNEEQFWRGKVKKVEYSGVVDVKGSFENSM